MLNIWSIVKVSLIKVQMNSFKRQHSKFIVASLLAAFFIMSSCKRGSDDSTIAAADEYYTCSMDPQVVENKPGNCPICHMKLIKVKKNNLKIGQIKLSGQQIKLANIKWDTIRQSNISKEITLTGKVAIDQNFTTAISMKISGRIEKLYIKNPGDKISKGQLLYEIYSEELNRTQQEFINSIGKNGFSKEINEAVATKLKLYGMSDFQIDNLRSSKKANEHVKVFSPSDGFILETVASEGEYLAEGATIFQTASLNSLWVEAELYLPNLENVKIGTKAELYFPGIDEKALSVKVDFIDPQVSTKDRFVVVRFKINNQSVLLKPGMLANISFQTKSVNALTLPVGAIIQDSFGANVWIHTSNGIFENKMVSLGIQNRDQVEITDGLTDGDVVVTSGAYLLNSEYIFKRGANPMEGHQGMPGMKM